ncbi:MAG: adenylosuccinate lyase [Pseudomonadota bacterium]
MSELELTALTAIGSSDGRYRNKVSSLSSIASEFGLIKYRVQVECEWFIFLAQLAELDELPSLTCEQEEGIRSIYTNFSIDQAEAVKHKEAVTNHDVKACEYFVKEALNKINGMAPYLEWVHFGCTSEDINNTAYALMVKEARDIVLLPSMHTLITTLDTMAVDYAALPMLSRTHGQTASPTTLGKELKNVSARLSRQTSQLKQAEILGKFNGAVGNFNAHAAAYPKLDWPNLSRRFLESLGLTYNPWTTQIEPHDYLAEIFHCLIRFNQILLDFNRDMWSYISIDYFKQKKVEGETGSSTMPHKVNPIDFENSEGNIGLANALLEHMSSKLQVSRWQRDLSDSTVLRNIGSAMAYCLIAYGATQKGLTRVEVNDTKISADLNDSWEVLAEPVQTIMRKHGLQEPYERLKEATRGQVMSEANFKQVLAALDLPAAALDELQNLTPANYIGFAPRLATLDQKQSG